MRASSILLLTLICQVSAAGELYETTEWDYENPATKTGAKAFDSILSLGLNVHGATIAYVDMLGTAESLTLYSQVSTDTGLPSPRTPNTWLHAIASTPKKGVTDDGWSRFDFRDLKLLVTDVGGGYPNFIDGSGPMFGATKGVFNAYDRYVQDPLKFTLVYWEMPSGAMPVGPVPMFRVVWETLDPPYVDTNGDANRDGRVDLNDFGILKASIGKHVEFRKVADFNGNSEVDLEDFAILKDNFGWKAGAAVPEPSSCLLMMSALLLFPVLRRVAR